MKVNLFTKIWILKKFFVSLQKSKYWGGSKDGQCTRLKIWQWWFESTPPHKLGNNNV